MLDRHTAKTLRTATWAGLLAIAAMALFASSAVAASPTASSGSAASVLPLSAVLEAEVNPQGKFTTAHFEYVDADSYFESGFDAARATAEQVVGSDNEVHQVSAEIGCPEPTEELVAEGACLLPDTEYRWRVVATNEDGMANAEGLPFLTGPAVEIVVSAVSEIGSGSARLSATVNPLGMPVSGYFELVDAATFAGSGFAEASSFPDVESGTLLDFGSSSEDVSRHIDASALAAQTTYYYRFHGINQLTSESVLGGIHSFATPPPEAADGGSLPPSPVPPQVPGPGPGEGTDSGRTPSCTGALHRVKALRRRANRARRAADRAGTRVVRRKMRRASRRSARRAQRISRNLRQCRQLRTQML